MDDNFAGRVSADHYVFCGNGEHENPNLDVIDIIFNSRAADQKKFNFWFSTTSGEQTEGTKKKEHFLKVEERADTLRGQSNGRLSLHFNKNASIELAI
jgi:hypothetical protein